MDKQSVVREKTSFESVDQRPEATPQSELIRCCEERIPAILYGPPGTGKTKAVMDVVRHFRDHDKLGKLEVVQFHRKFTYEDFIEGYTPNERGFVKKDGIFKSFCLSPTRQKTDFFVIDEINRAEIATTFGEVLYALEDRESRVVKTAHFGDEFSVPSNLMLIGTMNTADRSVAHIDFAVRRRFSFIPVFPSIKNLRDWLLSLQLNISGFEMSAYCDFVQRTNGRISRSSQLGPHMQLGEAMFVPHGGGKKVLSDEDFLRNFRDVVLPQVESYLGFGGKQELAQLFGAPVVERFLISREVVMAEFVGLVQESANDKSS